MSHRFKPHRGPRRRNTEFRSRAVYWRWRIIQDSYSPEEREISLELKQAILSRDWDSRASPLSLAIAAAMERGLARAS